MLWRFCLQQQPAEFSALEVPMHKIRKEERRLSFALSLIAVLILSSCGEAPPPELPANEISVVDISSELISEAELEIADEAQTASTDSDYIDLTIMSSTVVYAEVYNMMYYPEKYVGKTIKMTGLYDDYYDEATAKRYHACIIMDATAWCAQGIEFILTDDYEYPSDYPEEADDITVEGVFDIYTEESGDYCTLRNARLLN
jgi:hypothetical protein